MKSYLLNPNGAMVEYKPKGSQFTLTELQKAIGGYVEMVTLKNGKLMWFDEEGLPKQLDVNSEASKLFGAVIVGPVLICESSQIY